MKAVVDIPVELRRMWGLPSSSGLGRPAQLDLPRVLRTAVRLADRRGLEGVSLPKIANALGYTTMSLYRYVGCKDELLSLMRDFAIGDPPVIETPARQVASGSAAVGLCRAPALLPAQLARAPSHRTASRTECDRMDGNGSVHPARDWSRLAGESRHSHPAQRVRAASGAALPGSCTRPRQHQNREGPGRETLRREPRETDRPGQVPRDSPALCLGHLRGSRHAGRR